MESLRNSKRVSVAGAGEVEGGERQEMGTKKSGAGHGRTWASLCMRPQALGGLLVAELM